MHSVIVATKNRVLLCVFAVVLALITSCQASNAAWPIVSRGDSDLNNANVTMVQHLLRNKGFAVVVDGHFGPQTQRQVRRFQSQNKLPLSGKVDKATWPILTVILHRGDRGEAVLAMQAALQQHDEKLPIDGHFGERTSYSVRKFKRTMHLPDDDTVNEVVWQRLSDSVVD